MESGLETAGLRERLQAALGEHYTLERELGGGGMARVFLAKENALGRQVVVKVLASDVAHELSAERFAREIRVSARLQHPNIIPVLTAGVTAAGGVPYYTMPYVDGESLRVALARLAPGEVIPFAEAVSVLRDVARALAYAHERGIVHRDVKPENVLLARDAAVVADFGIAKAVEAARVGATTSVGATALTQAGAALGTPAYMAPEQAVGDVVDQRTDVYAWGLIAYEVLAGVHPFAGRRSAHALIVAHLTETPAPLRDRCRDLPASLEALVVRCLAKDPAHRPANAREIVDALGALARPAIVTAASSASVGDTHDAAGGRRSVAVLPLANTSGDAENEHFSDGLTDELIGALSQVESLAVTGRTSSFALKGKGLSVREVAGTLRVATVLEGSVRRAGDRLKVRVQLVNADGGVLWSDAYDRRLTDVFAVQEEIAQAVVRSLEGHLSASRGPLVRAPTADLTAYDLYLQATSLRRMITVDDLRRAAACFEQAVSRDPSYARAYAGLSHTHFLLAVLAGRSPGEEVARARASAVKALALDPSRAEGHWALAQVLFVHDWDWAPAAAEFEAALALDPGSVDARHLYAIFLLCRGRLAEAEAQLLRALATEPLLPEVHNTLGRVYLAARQPDRAIQAFGEALALSPAFFYARAARGHAYVQQGRCGDALGDFVAAAATGGASGAAHLAYGYAACGQHAEAVAVLRALLAGDGRGSAPPFQVATAYAGLRDADAAFHWLELACTEHDLHVAGLDVHPAFDPLRSDPRFGRLLRRMGLDA